MSEMKALREKIKDLKILVVDDEPSVLEGTVEFMKKFFITVLSAANADEALSIYDANKGIDVVLSDVKMPGMNGWKLIERLREMDPHIFLGIMTGSPDEYPEKMEVCNLYLKKPISIDEMMALMQQLITYKASK